MTDNTKVVIANPARPNGAGFAGDHPALGALGVGALGVTEPSKVPSSGPVAQPAAARRLRGLEPEVPSPSGSFIVRKLPVVRIRTQRQSTGGVAARRTAQSARQTVAFGRALAI
jgi:hypothetical protein